MTDKLYILIGVDCDHDRQRFNKAISSKKISWLGYKRFYKHFNIARQKVFKYTGLMPVLTLNIRADFQVKKALSRYNACFDIFEKYLSKKFYKEDEIAWHNHQWRLKNKKWFQETSDEAWLEENIRNSFDAIKRYNISTVHAGWHFQNTFTMNLYNDLGIKVDYSGLPGAFKHIGNCDKYDYKEIKNNHIYIPSRNDYQKEETNKRNKILEMPKTTAPSLFLNFLDVADRFYKTKKISLPVGQNVCLTATIHPALYNIFLKNIFKENKPKYFITFFHSDELLPDKLKSAQMRILFKQNNIYHNLMNLISIAKKKYQTIEFINFKQFLKIYESGYFN